MLKMFFNTARRRDLILLGILYGLLFVTGFSCSVQKALVPVLSPDELWHHIKQMSVSTAVFKGEGEITIETALGQKFSFDFSAAAIADSMLRVDFYTPFGSNLATVRIIGCRYRLDTFKLPTQRGEYTDSLFFNLLNVNIPLWMLKDIFSAHPFLPVAQYDSASRDNSFQTYYTSEDDSVHMRMSVNLETRQPQKLVISRKLQDLITVLWSKYSRDIPYKSELFFSNRTFIKVEFDKIESPNVLAPEIFSLE